jgi:hypothetical protein
MRKQIRPVALVIYVAAFIPILGPGAQAKQLCSAAAARSHGGWWSYRIIDGRKCWYEGKPGLAKTLLEWPHRPSSKPSSNEELARATPVETPGNPLDAQAWAPSGNADTFEELWRARVLSNGR